MQRLVSAFLIPLVRIRFFLRLYAVTLSTLIEKLYRNSIKMKLNFNTVGFNRQLFRKLHKIVIRTVISKFTIDFTYCVY